MTPLDLTKAPPRSPREELRGLCMLPRMIDIARATPAGGRKGVYLIGRPRSLSAVVLGSFGLTAQEFVDVVRDVRIDEEVAERLWPAAKASPEALGRRLRRLRVADVPPEVMPDFLGFYGEQPADRFVFDVLDEDDARAFASRV